MTQPPPQAIIDAQRQHWNRVAEGWEKWDRFFDEKIAYLNHRLVADVRMQSDMKVLDLGSGIGHPALLGAQTVGKSGGIVGMDIAERMLAVARRKAAALGLGKCDVPYRRRDDTPVRGQLIRSDYEPLLFDVSPRHSEGRR